MNSKQLLSCKISMLDLSLKKSSAQVAVAAQLSLQAAVQNVAASKITCFRRSARAGSPTWSELQRGELRRTRRTASCICSWPADTRAGSGVLTSPADPMMMLQKPPLLDEAAAILGENGFAPLSCENFSLWRLTPRGKPRLCCVASRLRWLLLGF